MNYETNTHYSTSHTEPGLGELFSNLSSQASLLIRQELQLAQAEMSEKASHVGRNTAFIALGAVLGQAAMLAIVAAVILALAQVMDAWLSALIVGVVLSIGAALLAQYGINKLKSIDPTPHQTIETIKENKEWLTRQV